MANTETTKTTYGGGASYDAAPKINSMPMVYAGTSDLTSGPLRYVEVAITAAEILLLRASPKVLVAAPGSGYVLEFLGAILIYDYATAFTESSANLVIENATGTDISEILEATGLVDATSDQIRHLVPAIVSPVILANEGLYLKNNGAAEYGGAGTSVFRVKVFYSVHATGL